MRRILIIAGIALIPIVLLLLVATGKIGQKQAKVNRVALTVWVTDDADRSALNNLVREYQITHPYLSAKVEYIRTENYADRLIQGWAQGKGPDIFFAPHEWIGGMQPYSTPMPNDLTVPVVSSTKGLFGIQTSITRPPVKGLTIQEVQEAFVDAAATEMIRENQIWALPLAMDTVATFVNKDLLNNARIFTPAATWDDLANQIANNNLTIIDDAGTIVQSAVALGTSTNVPYATDLLPLLMMQNGSAMIDHSAKKVRLNDAAGLNALDFYTSFALSKRATYSWDSNQPNALDAFLKGRVAYYFGTYADRERIAASSLNWTVAPMLHASNRGDKDGPSGSVRFINAARYNVGMVSRSAATAKRSVHAWSLLRFFAHSAVVEKYLRPTNQLAALKTILQSQKAETGKAVFAEQLLTTRSWYRGRDALHVEEYLRQLIASVLSGTDPKPALDLATRQIEATL